MNKILGITIPYLIIAFIGLMSFISIEYQLIINSFVVGLLIGLWMYVITKCEGTNMMKSMMFVNTVLFIGLIIIGFVGLDSHIFSEVSKVSMLLLPIQFVAYYMVLKNKPRLSMSYRYSFKNKRKRYF